MYHQSLPGFCSAHWVIFVTATCCTNEKTDDENLTDCERVERLYEDTMYVLSMSRNPAKQSSEELAFGNTKRSRVVVHEIWKRNQGGKVFIDWLDIIKEWDWQLWLV
jgi:transcriptional activator protein UGA3